MFLQTINSKKKTIVDQNGTFDLNNGKETI